KWAEHNPITFWQAADLYERKNGSTYREYEIALPREMNTEQRLELVEDFIQSEIGSKYTYKFEIYNLKEMDGKDQHH
ncbi:MobA/MobL family protein, partial [Acinetobacter schindleri]|uniref:MobA/MobL family protein n=1 Tax=Acinetobacter schindleri TaxID=108981 RepID=UPI0030F5C219